MKNHLTYKDAGVDIDRGNALVSAIGPLAARTRRPEVRTSIGGFGALFDVPTERYKKPVLVSGTDGVGTKIRLALDHDHLDGIGIDLVAMCVNDILTLGAEPLFFLDYLATGKLDDKQALRVIEGIAVGCEQSGAALIGGETAEMPGMYAPGDIDLAGFCVGIVDEPDIIDGSNVKPGDAIVGLTSSGPHSNGYSLIRHILSGDMEVSTDELEALLAPTRIYVQSIHHLMKSVKPNAMVHITGGGLIDNVPRVLPDKTCAVLDSSSWTEPDVFSWLAQQGGVERREMYRTFNCGLGYLVVVDAARAEDCVSELTTAGESATVVGQIELWDGTGEPVTIV